MKKISSLLFIIFTIVFNHASVGQVQTFGEKFEINQTMAIGDLAKQMISKDNMEAIVEGKVASVCQTKGCWMKLDLPDGGTMRVTFKDYGFFVPKDISGSTVVIKGTAQVSTTSVEELRHYAEDAGKSKEDIAKITQPKTELVFEAEGVVIK